MERQHAQLKAELEEIQKSRTVNERALATYASSEQDVQFRSSHELKVCLPLLHLHVLIIAVLVSLIIIFVSLQYRELIEEKRRMEAQFSKLVDENEAANLALRKRRNHARAELAKGIVPVRTRISSSSQTRLKCVQRSFSRAVPLCLIVSAFLLAGNQKGNRC